MNESWNHGAGMRPASISSSSVYSGGYGEQLFRVLVYITGMLIAIINYFRLKLILEKVCVCILCAFG